MAEIDDESTDMLRRLILFCLCADLIADLRIFFHIPFCCKSWNLLCADDLEPYCTGKSIHLHPVINTKIIALIVVRSLLLGLPVGACFGRCGRIVFSL